MRKRRFRNLIDQQIADATDRGDFDNLPGKGKPLNLDGKGTSSPEWLANRILKNANALPEWIELQRNIEEGERQYRSRKVALLNRLREAQTQAQAGELDQGQLEALKSWYARSKVELAQELEDLNQTIRRYNWIVPTSGLQKPLWNRDMEIRNCEEAFQSVSTTLQRHLYSLAQRP